MNGENKDMQKKLLIKRKLFMTAGLCAMFAGIIYFADLFHDAFKTVFDDESVADKYYPDK